MNDFDADGKPDVIATRDCADSNVGVTYWSMYAGTASGFSTTGKSLALPSLTSVLAPYVGIYGAPVAAAYGTGTCNHNAKTGTLDYFIHDLDGDGRLDLVITKDDCDGASVGTSVWRLYAGTGTTFATSPTSWTLPSQPLTGIWQNYGYGASCSTANWTSWSFADYTGDKRPEIVIDHDDCVDKTVKSTHWDVYVNTGSGFATNATTWSYPLTVPTNTQHACGFADGSFFYVYWQTQDITGDGIPDFMLTENGCGNDATLGVDHWAVYAGKCQ
jgi:hypothetical protein